MATSIGTILRVNSRSSLSYIRQLLQKLFRLAEPYGEKAFNSPDFGCHIFPIRSKNSLYNAFPTRTY